VNEKTSVQVLAICGSLCEGSFNLMAMRAAIALAPKQMRFVEGAIADIPLYNEDVRLRGEPAAVALLKRQGMQADALFLPRRNIITVFLAS